MHKTHWGVGILGIIIGAASMVVVYASGVAQPASGLPQTATVTLQDWWNNWKGGTSGPRAGETFDYSQFEQIYALLKSKYYDQDKLATGVMLEGALKGMVAALGDPYTTFLDVQQNTSFTEELKGEQDFEGIGAAIAKKDDAIEIQEIYKGTPSFDAGLRPLDLIIAISGAKTTDMTADEAVKLIRGPEGTAIQLTILRPSETEANKRVFTIDITRRKVVIPSVASKVLTMGTRKIGYINVSIIGQETENAMKKEVAAIKAQGVDGIILDLRGNGGGFLDIGVKVASHFIPKDTLVVATKYRVESLNEDYKSEGYGEFENTPLVVLVDGLTASAGEIIAAALRDTRGAVIVGAKTFGKGSIQTIQDFGSGAAIKYTIGRWFTPNNINVDHEGLVPDVDVPFDTPAYQKTKADNQLERAKEEIIKLIK